MLPNQGKASWYSRLIWITLTLVVSLAVCDAALAPTPAPSQPDFIDAFLASRAVVVAVRIAIIFAAVFVALSVIALIVRRQWLTRVGPVEVSSEVSNLDAEIRLLDEEIKEANRVIEGLRQQLRIHINC